MFIDIHIHSTSFPGITWPKIAQTFPTPEQIIEMYDEAGIDMGVLLPCVNPEGTHVVQSNEEFISIVEKHGDRLLWFCNIDPRTMFNEPYTDLGYYLSYYKDLGARGVGEICCNLYFDDPRVLNLFAHCEKLGMPVDFHVATSEGQGYGLIDDLHLPRFEKVVQEYQDLVFLCHSQPFWAEISGDLTEHTRGGYPSGQVVQGGRVVELMRRYPNVVGDLSAGSGYNAVSRDPEFGYWFMTEFQDQLCFGTDVCFPKNRDDVLVNLKCFLEKAFAAGKIDRNVFDKISHRNAERILGL